MRHPLVHAVKERDGHLLRVRGRARARARGRGRGRVRGNVGVRVKGRDGHPVKDYGQQRQATCRVEQRTWYMWARARVRVRVRVPCP